MATLPVLMEDEEFSKTLEDYRTRGRFLSRISRSCATVPSAIPLPMAISNMSMASSAAFLGRDSFLHTAVMAFTGYGAVVDVGKRPGICRVLIHNDASGGYGQ